MGSGALVLGCNTRASREVTHPSTTLAQARFTAEFLWDQSTDHYMEPAQHGVQDVLNISTEGSPVGIRATLAARLRVKAAEFGPENCPVNSLPFMVSEPFRNCAMGDIVPHGSNVMRGATRGLPERSPILVQLSPKHAYLRSSDGIRCISAGMIAPVGRLRVKKLNLGPENCPVYLPPFMVSGPFQNGAMGDVVPHGSKVMSTLDYGVLMGSGALVLYPCDLESFKQVETRLWRRRSRWRLCDKQSLLVIGRVSNKWRPGCGGEGAVGGCVTNKARLRVKTAEFEPGILPRQFYALYGSWAFPKWCPIEDQSSGKLSRLFTALYGFSAFLKWGARQGLPGRSPILVLLSPKHAYLWSSDGIQSISAGMIAP
uniref:Uncharacterized protein n=1 Tax=Brassica oleracea var. oleracea TaxID=109376 RepID=A0A0D2ZS91_BRAOL